MKRRRLFGSGLLAMTVGALPLLPACGQGDSPGSLTSPGGSARQTSPEPARDLGTHQPYASLGMNSGDRDPAGRPVRIACTVCHDDVVKHDPSNAEKKQLDHFHEGVVLDHGTHSNCLVCHAPPRFDSFRLASGKSVTYGNVVELCAQCHSRQWQDYQHGAHGGMTGYWDKQSGPRDRNHCLDCHNPHSPAAKKLQPAPRPNVRFQKTKEPGHG